MDFPSSPIWLKMLYKVIKSHVYDIFYDGMAEKISDGSSGVKADDFYHRYKVIKFLNQIP